MTRDTERSQAHVWRFFRAGGFDQVRLDNARDIAAVPTLDQKLWVALACPPRGIIAVILSAVWRYGFLAPWLRP